MAESRGSGRVRDRSAQSECGGSVRARGADRLGQGHTGTRGGLDRYGSVDSVD
jgi:hypothetical protein